MTQIGLQTSLNGQVYVAGSKTFTEADKIAYLVVNSTATFGAITDSNGNNVLTDSEMTTSTEIGAGMIIAPRGSYLLTVNVTAGSVLCVRG